MSVTGARMVNLKKMVYAIKSKEVLIVYKLPLRASPGVIRSYFENYGPVEQVYRGISIPNAAYIGVGLVQFRDKKTAENVMMQREHKIDGRDIMLKQCNFVPSEIRQHEGWQSLTFDVNFHARKYRTIPQ